MLKNFLLLAFRNLQGNKLFAAINIVGLAIGLTCVILILLFVRFETSFDKHWANSDRIYKVMRTFTPGGRAPLELAANAPQVGPLLAADYPEFEQVQRIRNAGQLIFTHPDTNQSFYEAGLLFVDPSIHEVFDVQLLAGTWEGALEAPFQMVVTQALAEKYFPGGDAVGESIVIANQIPVQITGIMADLGANSHIEANAFISMATPVAMFGEGYVNTWGSNNFHTYIVVP
ncbi:MAG: ABC transporter permease, partial [Pseudomonadales bacterium]|nr:ABC transporter permease [Pseudomonadales bacterium]